MPCTLNSGTIEVTNENTAQKISSYFTLVSENCTYTKTLILIGLIFAPQVKTWKSKGY